MGKTFSTGLLTNGIWQDASNNIGIGAAASGSYKLQVTGDANITGTLSSGNLTANGTSSSSRAGTLALKHNTFAGLNYEIGWLAMWSTGSTNLTIGYDADAGNVLSFDFSLQNQDNNYIFPNQSGTLALTSDIPSLSGYVPYTGATSNVSLGNYELGAKYITSAGSSGLGGVVNIKQDATYLPKGNGYSSIASSFTAFDFYGYTGASTYKNFQLKFDGLTNNTLRTFTLPDASGTIALLSGTQTFTGATTFSSAVTIGNYDGQALKLQSATSTGSSYMRFYNSAGTSRGYLGLFWDGSADYMAYDSGALKMNFNSSNSFTFTGGGASTFSGNVIAPQFYANYVGGGFRGIEYQSSGTIFGYSKADPSTGEYRHNIGPSAGWGGFMTFLTDTSERMRITPAGNVGIGTSSPYVLLSVYGASAGDRILIDSSTGSGSNGAIAWGAGGTPNISARIKGLDDGFYGTNLIFETRGNSGPATNTIERMRITSGGGVSIGTTTNAGKIHILGNLGQYTTWIQADSTSSQSYGLMINAGTNSSDYSMYVRNAAQGSPYIYIRGDGYLYSASAWSGSDRRLKENIVDLDNGLNKVLGLKARKFDFIDGFKNQYGFIAQELQEVIPDAVSVFDEENKMLAVKMDFIVPHLVKAIQEQQAQIEELKNKLK